MRTVTYIFVLVLTITIATGCGSKQPAGANPNANMPPTASNPANPTLAASPGAAQDMTQPGATQSNPTTTGVPPTSSVGPEISMVAMDYHSSLIKGDKDRLEPMLADEYQRTREDGKVFNKAQELASLKKSDDMFSMEAQPAKVDGDTATVTGKITLRSASKPEQVSGTWQTTDTVKKRNGKWVIVSSVMKKG